MHRIIAEDIQRIIQGLGDDAAKLAGKTVLITGGAGFIGSYMVATLARLNAGILAAPCRVISIDNYITGSKKNLLMDDITDPNISCITHDVRQPIPSELKADFLVHAAGVASPLYYKKFPLETVEGTIFGIKNLLEHAKNVAAQSVLYFSSSEIYGDPDPNFIPTPENYKGNVSCIGPRSCYDESKRLGETYCSLYHSLFQVPVNTVRPFNVFGPGMKLNDYRVIPNFFLNGLEGKPLPVHDKGNQTRTFCYVTDAIIGFFKVLLADKHGEIYNVGNADDEINMLALAGKVAVAFGGTVTIQLVSYPDAYPTDEPRRRCPDLTKIKRDLGYTPLVNLQTGIERSLAWFKDEKNNSSSQ